MPKRSTIVILIIVAVLVGLGGWWFIAAQPSQPTTPPETSTSTPSESQQPTTSSADESAGITIVFTNNGFEEQSYSVSTGQTVTVKNESSMTVEFSSDEHPTHTDNTELNMSALQPGQQGTFTPERTGEWGIHDHEHPEFTTSLLVTN